MFEIDLFAFTLMSSELTFFVVLQIIWPSNIPQFVRENSLLVRISSWPTWGNSTHALDVTRHGTLNASFWSFEALGFKSSLRMMLIKTPFDGWLSRKLDQIFVTRSPSFPHMKHEVCVDRAKLMWLHCTCLLWSKGNRVSSPVILSRMHTYP